jgi:hypothetical protein
MIRVDDVVLDKSQEINTFMYGTLIYLITLEIMKEKDLEDLICKYPDVIENGLSLIGRQVTIFGRRIDLLFQDKFGRQLLIELKAGPIKDEHIGQIMSYEGMLLSHENPDLRIMIVGTRVPPNLAKSLDHHGIAWKELSVEHLADFVNLKGEETFIALLNNEITPYTIINNKVVSVFKGTPNISPPQKESYQLPNDRVKYIKGTDTYKSFYSILSLKRDNEERAKDMILAIDGNNTYEQFKEIIRLVDEPYPYYKNGKLVKSNGLEICLLNPI